MSPRIVIAGGGLAGLAAVVALTDRGFPCTLLESRPRLGGRASSFHDTTSNTDIDNCQHVTLGCCTNFRHFCERVGLQGFFRREPALYFVGPGGKINPFAAGWLPAPLHLTGAFARLSYLSWSDKLSLARGLKALAGPVSPADESQPFSAWLTKHHQTPTTIERFWFVVLVSALSESLERISVSHARKVFVDAFLAHRDGWYVDIPSVPLEELYGGLLTEWLTSRGTTIRLQSAANQVEMSGDHVSGIRLGSDEVIVGDEFVVALPFFRVMSILPPMLQTHPDLQGIERLESAPISSIHLWLDRPIMDLPHVVLVDRVSQWVFNRTVVGASTKPEDGKPRVTNKGEAPSSLEQAHYYQIVISASHQLASKSKSELEQIVLQELAEIWPEAARAKLLHSRHVTEHRAVFSPLPGVDLLRPSQQSPIPNLQLAGDWTKTEWPATMEGAVRSGFLAAENILRRMGQPAVVLQPPLKTALLSRWLFGL